MQFTGEGWGTDTQGNLIHVKITKDGFIGNTFADKIVFGTMNWFFHLISDFDGSSGSVLNGSGKGTGIPGPILSLLKELSVLPVFKAVDEDNINKPKIISEYISKLFNGTLIKSENGESIRFDLRTENQYKFGYSFLSLNERQLQVLYSLKALAVEAELADMEDTLFPNEKCKKGVRRV